jgi:hypothetical protein
VCATLSQWERDKEAAGALNRDSPYFTSSALAIGGRTNMMSPKAPKNQRCFGCGIVTAHMHRQAVATSIGKKCASRKALPRWVVGALGDINRDVDIRLHRLRGQRPNPLKCRISPANIPLALSHRQEAPPKIQAPSQPKAISLFFLYMVHELCGLIFPKPLKYHHWYKMHCYVSCTETIGL